MPLNKKERNLDAKFGRAEKWFRNANVSRQRHCFEYQVESSHSQKANLWRRHVCVFSVRRSIFVSTKNKLEWSVRQRRRWHAMNQINVFDDKHALCHANTHRCMHTQLNPVNANATEYFVVLIVFYAAFILLCLRLRLRLRLHRLISHLKMKFFETANSKIFIHIPTRQALMRWIRESVKCRILLSNSLRREMRILTKCVLPNADCILGIWAT